MTRDEFYRVRDSRSLSYLRTDDLDPEPVGITWGDDAASTPSGQIVLTSLINLIARFARRIVLAGPDSVLLVPSIVQRRTLHDSLLASATAIDPFGTFEFSRNGQLFTLGIGCDAPGNANVYVGASDWRAVITPDREVVPTFNGEVGAAAAACIAAAAAFQASLKLERPLFTGTFSCATWSSAGPERLDTPVAPHEADLGTALVIGAGAVASAFAYWCKVLGVKAVWDIVDKDVVDFTNTNRGMLFLAQHAGYEATPAAKAEILAQWLPAATPHLSWYHEFISTDAADRRWDVTFPLANDYNARADAQSQYPALMLHATTGEHWETYLHRHRPARDGCICCRFPGDVPVPQCATGEISRPQHGSSDAALPFMSAAAGLMLAVDCLRLTATSLTEENFFLLDWSAELQARSLVQRCATQCRRWGDADVRRRLNQATRWFRSI